LHEPVLKEEVLAYLEPKPGDCVLDLTAGMGGHTAALAERVRPGGCVIAVDRDAGAVEACRKRCREFGETVRCVHGNFRSVKRICTEEGIREVRAILIDCGISSAQLDDGLRGFSFQHEGPLDMRMDRQQKLRLEEFLGSVEEKELADAIYKYGEERYSRRIARSVLGDFQKGAVRNTKDLAECIQRSVPRFYARGRIHPATRTFQALRICVNDELSALEEALDGSLEVLAEGGRMAVIAFHSLEDRIIKRRFRGAAKEGLGICANRKPLRPGDEETQRNPRARSAKMRVFERHLTPGGNR